MSTKHQPGPWRVEYYGAGDQIDACEIMAGGYYIAKIHEWSSPDPQCSGRAATAERIVACVNACEGIADPASLRAQRDELLAALREMLAHARTTRDRNAHAEGRALAAIARAESAQ
jgi:hypothetical protein